MKGGFKYWKNLLFQTVWSEFIKTLHRNEGIAKNTFPALVSRFYDSLSWPNYCSPNSQLKRNECGWGGRSGDQMALLSTCSLKVFYLCITSAWLQRLLHCLAQTKKGRVNYLKGKGTQEEVNSEPKEIISAVCDILQNFLLVVSLGVDKWLLQYEVFRIRGWGDVYLI